MRWNETCVLLSAPRQYQDDFGAWHTGEQERREVFCNTNSVGYLAWANPKARGDIHVDAGARPDAAIQLRSIDFQSEPPFQECIYREQQYDIDAVVEKGDFVVLTLIKRVSNE